MWCGGKNQNKIYGELMGALFVKKSSNKIKYLFQVEMIYPRKILGALHVPVMTRFAYSQVHVLKIATPEFEISYCNLTTLFFSYSFYYTKNADCFLACFLPSSPRPRSYL